MNKSKPVIEYVCEGGIGGSMSVCVELRTEFPGIGDTILILQKHSGMADDFHEPPALAEQGRALWSWIL